MASFLAISMILIASYFSPFITASKTQLKLSTISAAPAFLPQPPLLSPSLSPDIEPEFPRDGAIVPSPSDSSFPTIPSSPSPPNPDDVFQPGLAPSPLMSFSPSGSLPVSSSTPFAPFAVPLLFIGLMAFWFLQVSS